MNYPAAMFWLTLAMTVINILISLLNWWNNRDKITNTRFKALEDNVGAMDKKVSNMETKIKTMPVCSNHNRMEENDTRLFQRLDALHGDIRELSGGVKGLGKSLEMINEFLLKGGK